MVDTHLTQTDTSTTWYPPHPPRVATDVYVRSHHQMIYVEDQPCWACGIRHSDCVRLAATLNGRAMETHHLWMEDAFTGEGGGPGGIYWPLVLADHSEFDWGGSGFQLSDPATWKFFVDSPANLQPLCSACHRSASPVPHWLAGRADPDRGGLTWLDSAASMGVHHVSWPEWRDAHHCLPSEPPFRTDLQAQPKVQPHTLKVHDRAALAQLHETPMHGHHVLLEPHVLGSPA